MKTKVNGRWKERKGQSRSKQVESRSKHKSVPASCSPEVYSSKDAVLPYEDYIMKGPKHLKIRIKVCFQELNIPSE